MNSCPRRSAPAHDAPGTASQGMRAGMTGDVTTGTALVATFGVFATPPPATFAADEASDEVDPADEVSMVGVTDVVVGEAPRASVESGVWETTG